MKKFLVVMVVLSLVCLSSIALAADVTVGGSVQVRSRNFTVMSFDKNDNTKNAVDTQERIMMDINAKAGDNVKGKISLWNDFEDWGNKEVTQGQGFGTSTGTTKADPHFGFREAWVSFNLPDIPVNVTAGHQLLQLGNGWFLRNKHFGDDAWVISNVSGPNTLAFVNIKISEGLTAYKASDDADAYAILDVFKINENMAVGIDIASVKVRPTTELQNYSLNFNGKFGPMNLMAQVDMQAGKITGGATEPKFKGNEIVIQGNVAMDPVTINFLLAQGSGQKSTDTDVKQYVNYLDIDPHYTFLYEYKLATAAGAKNTGFANTTAIGAGVMFAAAKSLGLGLDAYYLKATKKIVSPYEAGPLGTGAESDKVGFEVDAHVNWKLYDNLTWNWDLGYFKPGDAFKTALGKTDAALGIQGVLAFKF